MALLRDPFIDVLAENHAQEILALEDSEAKRIMKSYRRVRQDLRDRLDQLPQGTFTAQRLRVVLAQVDAALDAMRTGVVEQMNLSAEEAAGMGIDHLTGELVKWDRHFLGTSQPINTQAVRAAAINDTFLFNQAELYSSGMVAYNANLRGRMAQGLMDAAITGEISTNDINGKLGKTFLGEEWKLERIIRTELHNVYSTGKLNGMTELVATSMPDLKKTLYHPLDHRTADDTKRLMKDNPIVSVDEPFIEESTGKTLTYMSPPNRPNDRAILIPYREAWGKQAVSFRPPSNR